MIGGKERAIRGDVSGAVVTAGGLAFDFIKIAGVGALIGIGIGLAVSQIIRHVDDPEVPRDSIILRDPS